VNVHVATSLADALQFKRRHPAARPLLGGTDVLAQWQAGAARPDDVLALESLGELQQLRADEEGVTIGAGVSHYAIAHDRTIETRLPALAHAARTVGAPAIQMMGTIGGNVANGSPAADLPPALLVYGGQVVVASERGERRVAMEWFYTGYRRVDVGPDELVVGLRVPWPAAGSYSAYWKVGTRAAQSIARVALAGCLTVRDGSCAAVRFAAASVAATPIRLAAVEDVVSGQSLTADLGARARATAAASISPIDDVRGSVAYRRHALGALVERFLVRAIAGR
jgi:CO/xanthine dehydrogenase FAD-binding subunit